MSKTNKRELEEKQRATAVSMLSLYIPMEMHLNALQNVRDKKKEAGEEIAVLKTGEL